jgi:predicted urease superfamily metal-dependent hydrolase
MERDTIDKVKKEAMVMITLRVPKYVMDYFQESPNASEAIRQILKNHIETNRS